MLWVHAGAILRPPVEARQRLNDWLTLNDTAPSRKAPKLTFDQMFWAGIGQLLQAMELRSRDLLVWKAKLAPPDPR